jgi:hypothetical protein
MWTHEESIEIAATPGRLWELFADVRGWRQWNAGIEHIELHGPFAVGTTFSMKLPSGEVLTSLLLGVREQAGFADETIIDGTRVVVRHELRAQPSGNTRVTYATEITGQNASEFGPLVTGDFGDVLRALKRLAEAPDAPA